MRLERGDEIVISARRSALFDATRTMGPEIGDPSLLSVPMQTAAVVVTTEDVNGTTLEALLEAMGGIKPPSFYNAFGSKEELYRVVTDRYACTFGQPGLDALEGSPSVRQGIAGLLRLNVENFTRRLASFRFHSRSISSAAFRAAAFSLIFGGDRFSAFGRRLSRPPRASSPVGRSECSAKRPLDPAGRLRMMPGFDIVAATTSGSLVSLATP